MTIICRVHFRYCRLDHLSFDLVDPVRVRVRVRVKILDKKHCVSRR